jgi:hypothetical protein
MSERSSIGEKRLEYLDLANKLVAARDYGAAELHLENFVTTIPDNSVASKDIQAHFDDIEKEKQENFLKVIKDTETLNAWIQTEQRTNMRDYYIVRSIKDRIEACWSIALKNGLFND